MNYVYQRWATDCSVACFAMMFDVSWWKAMKILFPFRRFIPLSSYRFDKWRFECAAEEMGYRIAYVVIDDSFPLDQLTDNAMIVVGNGAEGKNYRSHAIMWDANKKTFLDPIRHNNLQHDHIISNMVWLAMKVV